jgi:chondroitin AC lyase
MPRPLALFAACVMASPPQLPPDADFLALQASLLTLLLPSVSDSLSVSVQLSFDSAVPTLTAAMTPSGLWPDVIYNDTDDRSEWLAAEHLRRCLILGISSTPTNAVSSFAGDALVQNATLSCTRGWITLNPNNTNWWWQQLGTPHAVAKLLLLAPSNASLAAASATIFPRLTLQDVAAFPGANRVWGAFIFSLVGAASGDAHRVDVAVPLLHNAMYAGDGDGIQADASFHQHGPLAYMSFGYGAHFAANALTMEAAARGTRWAMNSSTWGGLARYVLDGARWTLRGSEFNIGLMGRHNTYYGDVDSFGISKGHYHHFAAYSAFPLAFPPLAPSPGLAGGGLAQGREPPNATAPFSSALAAHYARLLPYFATAPRGDEMMQLHAQVAAGNGSASSVAGHAYFYLSDAAAHVRAGFAMGLHLFSNRTLNTECVNGEGVQNRAMADGLLTVQVTGQEYRDVAPVWRWSLAPGTTELQTSTAYECDDAQILDASERRPFVGGAGDGWAGAAALDFRRVDSGSTLTARKSWFFFEEGAVAVGSDIVGDGRFNITTAIDQRRLATGGVWVGFANGSAPELLPSGGFIEAHSAAWVWHDKTIHVSLAQTRGAGLPFWGVSSRTQSGSWANVTQGPSTLIEMPMFLSHLHHGAATSANPGAYAFAILPGAAASPVDAPAAVLAFTSRTVIVEASSSRHAVCRSAPNSTLAWMHSAVEWPAAMASRGERAKKFKTTVCPDINVSAPSIILASLSSDMHTLSVTAASPLPGVTRVAVSVAGVLLSGPQTDACRNGVSGGVVVELVLPEKGASVSTTCGVVAAQSN